MTRGKAAACLRGVNVLLTGFSDQTRQELQQLVVDLGGNCTLDCSISPQPDVLVAPSVNSSKYKATVAAQPNIPTHTADWLKACERTKSKVSFTEHRLAPFAGLEICISGYVKRKAQMGSVINQFGGRYNAELNKATCDVLVCELPSGQKYKVGRTWGKDIVSDKWLEASVAANHCKDPTAYDLESSRMVDPPTSRVAPGPAPVLAREVQPTWPYMPVLPDDAQAASVTTALQPAAAVAACSVPQQQQQLPGAVRSAGVQQLDRQQHRQQKQGSGEALGEKPTTWKQKTSGEVQQTAKSGVPHVVLHSRSTAEERQDDQDCLFLSGVRLHLCCCTPEEQLQLVRIAREGCALRHTDLSPGLTHIVVGSDLTEAEVQAMKAYVQQHRSEVQVVQADWLRSCGQQRSLLAASNGYLVPLATLTAPQPRSSPGKQEQPQGKPSVSEGGQGGRNSGGTAGHGLLSGGEEGAETQGPGASQAPKHQALKGFWFTLAGLELGDKAEAQRAQALVRRHGGRRFTSQTLHLLQGVDKSNVLALCPCSLTKQKIAQLQSWGDFTSVPEKQRVSMLWLEWVIQSGQIIPYQPRGSVACRPFPYSLPLPGMTDIRVTVSSYPDDVKASIEQLVSIMGGRYSTSLSKKNSHLLIRAAAGPKFSGCAARRVIPVTADWLIESAHAGRLLDERDFHPPALAEGDSDAGFSQMPFDTQAGTQGCTQANLLTRFGAVDLPSRQRPPGAGQAPSKPLSLLQRVAQDAKRKSRGDSPGGQALARELNQAHSIPPAGVLPPPKFQSSTAQPAQPASSASGMSLLDAMLEGSEPGCTGQAGGPTGPTTFEGIAKSLKETQEADGSTGDVRAADDDRSKGNAAAQRQTEGPSIGQSEGAADRQPEGALQSALSRLGGMLESGGPLMHHMCSQFEAPAEAPPRGSGTGGWPQSVASSGKATFPSVRASCARDTTGALDGQNVSQSTLQRAKRKAREGAAGGGRGKRPAKIPDDTLMSQIGCSQQVGYEGANMSTGIGPLSRLRGDTNVASTDPYAGCSSAEAVGYLAKAEAGSRQRLAQAAMSRQLHTVDKDDLHEMGLM
ncbi:hypothetical protein WJX77_001689 [Trebouxia sp. C0004]